MKRRDFMLAGLPALAGTALAAEGIGSTIQKSATPETPDFAAIAKQRAAHPLYFDGMSFWGGTENWVSESGLCGLMWDVSTAEAVPGQPGRFKRNMIPCLKSIARANACARCDEPLRRTASAAIAVPPGERAGRPGTPAPIAVGIARALRARHAATFPHGVPTYDRRTTPGYEVPPTGTPGHRRRRRPRVSFTQRQDDGDADRRPGDPLRSPPACGGRAVDVDAPREAKETCP